MDPDEGEMGSDEEVCVHKVNMYSSRLSPLFAFTQRHSENGGDGSLHEAEEVCHVYKVHPCEVM